jgi:hypothetical protein
MGRRRVDESIPNRRRVIVLDMKIANATYKFKVDPNLTVQRTHNNVARALPFLQIDLRRHETFPGA